MNAWFLAIVAIWRVALLIAFLRVIGPMGIGTALLTGLGPLMLIVAALTILNLHRVVFDLMAGFQEQNPNNAAYNILIILTFISFYAAIPTLLVYLCCACVRWSGRQQASDE